MVDSYTHFDYSADTIAFTVADTTNSSQMYSGILNKLKDNRFDQHSYTPPAVV